MTILFIMDYFYRNNDLHATLSFAILEISLVERCQAGWLAVTDRLLEFWLGQKKRLGTDLCP